MARKRIFTPLRIVSVVTALGLLGAPYGGSLGWASNYESRGVRLTGQQQHMERRSPTATQTTSPTLLEQSPRTLDEYAAYVQNRLQVEAMKLRQQGTAEVKLTIDKDGSVRQAEIMEVEGSSMLGEQVKPLVNQIAPLPPLPGNAEVLVVTTTLAFNYPGENLMDRFGRGRQSSN
jgi:TonB family protein